MEIFDFSQKTTKELEERLDYLFNVAVEKNKERIKAARALENFLETEVIDFLICTPDLQPLVAVQLNRKAKVEFALQNAGYRCVTFDTIDNAAITTIKRMLRS